MMGRVCAWLYLILGALYFCSATDIWAYGVVLWEMWSQGDMPYGRWSEHKV